MHTIYTKQLLMEKLKLIDLFAGTGAFSYVANKYKIKCVYANDYEKSSKSIYDLNHKNKLTLKNINEVKIKDIGSHNILCAGFPCQPFSIAGERKGFDDERANVFWKMLKIIKKYKPDILILENVKNLQTHDNGCTFNTIKSNLEKLKYHIKYSVLNTSEITKIPQNRERIYFMCFKNKKLYDKFDFSFNKVKNKKIKSLLEKNILNKYYYTDKYKVYDKIKSGVVKHIKTNTIYQYRRYYIRENKNNVCPTLTANMGSGGHNVPLLLDDKGIRKLTPRECFNLQGFPKKYKLPDLSNSKLYKLAGNAVSIPVIELLFHKLSEIIK